MKPSDPSLACCLSERDRLQRVAAARPGTISFAGGLPDPRLFPTQQLAQAFLAAVEVPGAPALQYGWPEGEAELRRHVAARLNRRGAALEAERVIITSGAQQGIVLALRACLHEGRRVGIDARSYPGALELLRSMRAELVPLESDAAAYYVMPSLNNPLGQSMQLDDRLQLLARARRSAAWVLEDDAYAELLFDASAPRPLLADLPERVLHIGTFSKALCPGLRIGWLVPPPELFKTCLELKQRSDLQANSLTQGLLQRYLAQGTFDEHLARARDHYARRADLLSGALRRYLPELRFRMPLGGFSIWVESDLLLSDESLLDAAVDRGVSFDAGRAFRWDGDPRLSFRLSFSCVNELDIEPGVVRLARALAQCRGNLRLARFA